MRLGVGGGGRLSEWVCERRCGGEREKRGREKQNNVLFFPTFPPGFGLFFFLFSIFLPISTPSYSPVSIRLVTNNRKLLIR